jgi:alanine racemase
VEPVGVFSHYAWAGRAGPPDGRGTDHRVRRGAGLAAGRGARFEVRHLANSAATLTNHRARYDVVRPASRSTASPRAGLHTAAGLGLRPAMSLLGRVAQ